MYFNIKSLLFSALILFFVTDVQCQRYQYYPLIKGWLTVHKVKATWDQAYQQCKDEGAVLASPLTEELAYEMKNLMADTKDSDPYFTDIKATFVPGVFVTGKSVPLEDLPVNDMITSLDSRQGNCTSMDRHTINVVSCETPLPYICYRKQDSNKQLTECGTVDPEYKLDKSTGSCYKLHEKQLKWDHAYSTCIAEGGYLAVLNDDQEAKVVEKVVSVNETYADDVLRETSSFSYIVTVGIITQNGNSNWISIHGDRIKDIYNTWESPYTPSDRHLCGGIKRHYESGVLSNYDCTDTRPFVCEKDPNTVLFKY